MSDRHHAAAEPEVSVVVPVWGDDGMIASLVASAGDFDSTAEWVVAAVNPGPTLRQLADEKCIRLVFCPTPSRGAQMNLGAAQARARLLCFHHADTAMTPEHLRALRAVAGDPGIVGGAFHRKFDSRHPWMRCWEKLFQRFDKGFGPFFGDQSIFVRTETFRAMGGFADIPLMEDLEFSGRMKREGAVRLLQPPIWSSPRRFHRLGNWSTSALNALFILLFYVGVSPSRLHRWYYRENPSAATRAAPGVPISSRTE